MQTNPIDTTQTLLVGITMGLPRQSRGNEQIAIDAEAKAKAEAGTVTGTVHYWKWKTVAEKEFTKGKNKGTKRKVISNHDGLDELREFQGRYKRAITHFARYPHDTGLLQLPAALAEPCLKAREKFEAEKPEIWKRFCYDRYPALRASAPSRMGSNFDPTDFPDLDECMERFVCQVVIVPMAPADQAQRIALLAPDIAKTIDEGANMAYAKGKKEGILQLFNDVMGPIEHAVTVLEKDGAKIFDTLVGNIISIVDLVPAYNTVFDNQHLADLAAQAKAAFGEIKPDDLRASNEAKAKMLESAKSIVNSFKPYQRKLAV